MLCTFLYSFFLIRNILELFQVHVKIKRRVQRFLIYSLLHTCKQPPPLSTAPTRVAHFVELRNLHRHIIITQSSRLTLRFTLVLHSIGLDTHIYIMMCIHRYVLYHTEYFYCPKNPQCSTYSSCPAAYPHAAFRETTDLLLFP